MDNNHNDEFTTQNLSQYLAEKILDKIDNLRQDFSDYKLDVQQQHEEMKLDLREHMKRSDTSEKRLDVIETEVKPLLESFASIKWLLGALTFTIALLGGLLALFR